MNNKAGWKEAPNKPNPNKLPLPNISLIAPNTVKDNANPSPIPIPSNAASTGFV